MNFSLFEGQSFLSYEMNCCCQKNSCCRQHGKTSTCTEFYFFGVSFSIMIFFLIVCFTVFLLSKTTLFEVSTHTLISLLITVLFLSLIFVPWSPVPNVICPFGFFFFFFCNLSQSVLLSRN